MKWRRRRTREERYAVLLRRFENKVDARLRRWANVLQIKSDKLTWRQKYILFMIFCMAVSVICASIIFNAIK